MGLTWLNVQTLHVRIVGEGTLGRDGAQDETRRFTNPLVASYLYVVLKRAYENLIYVRLHYFA
jgi:hypothetical protein